MDKDIKEITAIWDKINELEKKLSDFTDIRHTQNADRIATSEEALCDVDEAYDSRMADVEEALCDLSEMMEG